MMNTKCEPYIQWIKKPEKGRYMIHIVLFGIDNAIKVVGASAAKSVATGLALSVMSLL